jgi:hypothetical protein
VASFWAPRASHDLRSALRLWAETVASCQRMTPDGYDRRYEPDSPVLIVLRPVKMRTALPTNDVPRLPYAFGIADGSRVMPETSPRPTWR